MAHHKKREGHSGFNVFHIKQISNINSGAKPIALVKYGGICPQIARGLTLPVWQIWMLGWLHLMLKIESVQSSNREIKQEGREEGREVEARSLVLRQLTRRVGELPQEVRSRVESLSLEQLENLGEALLDFTSMAD